MKKLIYLSVINLKNQDGYDKKTLSQIEYFHQLKFETTLLCFWGDSVIQISKKITKKLFFSTSKLLKRLFLCYSAAKFTCFIKPEVVYIRYPKCDLFLCIILGLIRINSKKTLIIQEIPTYPFVLEINKKFCLCDYFLACLDKVCRPINNFLVHKYAVVAYKKRIFNKDSFYIENGCSKEKVFNKKIKKTINLAYVANFSNNNIRHAFDDLKKSFYGLKRTSIFVNLYVIGNCKKHVEEVSDKGRIIYTGYLKRSELKKMYRKIHFGFGCLGFHKIGVTHSSSLKEREYFSFGIPYASNAQDYIFGKKCKYRLELSKKIKSIDLNNIINKIKKLYLQKNVNQSIARYAMKRANWAIAMKNFQKNT